MGGFCPKFPPGLTVQLPEQGGRGAAASQDVNKPRGREGGGRRGGRQTR